uniref:Reverse transcriptase domain-containing protein n=1 Tax=Tanacetum cinerariifolium TaxID=118510 RepID=A0A6L2JTN0_TANCI|nr:reverse transcriptase domain-containing protein [Tanacetum cinerariifolium]
MANTTPLVTTVTKPVINPGDADTTPMVNIQEFCEVYYEDILPIIMEKVCHDRRKDVHTSTKESYGDSFSHSYRDGGHSRHMKRIRDNKSPPSSVSRSDSSDGKYRRTRMPNNVKTYDGTGDPEDHVKVFQAAAQVERWVMPTWCHMFNSTLIGAVRVWIDELPLESIDGYKDLKAAFLSYFMQQKKYVKDLVEIHNIKQKKQLQVL